MFKMHIYDDERRNVDQKYSKITKHIELNTT